MTSENSRTFLLDRDIVRDLASPDFGLRHKAMSQLPEALDREEVNDVAMQVSLVPGAYEVRKGEKLEKEVLFHLGGIALLERDDLVTAESVTKELRARLDMARYIGLSLMLRKAKKRIVRDLMS